MADSNVTSAATALKPMRKPGRPTGSGSFRTKPVDFDIRATVDALVNIASKPGYVHHWDWDANDYPDWDDDCWDVDEVPPILTHLNKYSELLLVLIRLARYDQPINLESAACLRRLFMHLHTRFEIFSEWWPQEKIGAGLSTTVPPWQQNGGD